MLMLIPLSQTGHRALNGLYKLFMLTLAGIEWPLEDGGDNPRPLGVVTISTIPAFLSHSFR